MSDDVYKQFLRGILPEVSRLDKSVTSGNEKTGLRSNEKLNKLAKDYLHGEEVAGGGSIHQQPNITEAQPLPQLSISELSHYAKEISDAGEDILPELNRKPIIGNPSQVKSQTNYISQLSSTPIDDKQLSLDLKYISVEDVYEIVDSINKKQQSILREIKIIKSLIEAKING